MREMQAAIHAIHPKPSVELHTAFHKRINTIPEQTNILKIIMNPAHIDRCEYLRAKQ